MNPYGFRRLIRLSACQATAVLLATAAMVSAAYALDLPTPGSDADQRVAIDSTGDADTLGNRSLDVNGTFAPFGSINENGFRVRTTVSWSWYRFVASEVAGSLASGRSVEGDVLLGYGWVLPRVSMIALLGPAVVHSEDDPGVIRDRAGAKAVVSLYARPTDQTMAYGQAFYSTSSQSYQVQAKVGLKILDTVYLGPETKFAGRMYSAVEPRLGAHLSGISAGPVQFSISAGWTQDRQLGVGHYISLNAYASF